MSSSQSKKQPRAPKPKHLNWLVQSRHKNQQACASLYKMLDTKCWANPMLGYDAKTLISIGFSLWRAAFLADKSGELTETNNHATQFLGEMLETNAIAFTQDRNARGFTFNYYLANVRFRLTEFKHDHKDFDVKPELLRRGGVRNRKPTERWDLYQEAFETALKHFAARLKKES